MENSGTKYAHPRVLLIDADTALEATLRTAGYNVSIGTFGRPAAVKPSDGLFKVPIDSASLPDLGEQELLIINTVQADPSEQLQNEHPAEGVEEIFQRANRGSIDPRPLVMAHVRPTLERVLMHGGIFIVIAGAEYSVDYVLGRYKYSKIEITRHESYSSWGFLGDLRELRSLSRRGKEISFLPPLLKRASEEAKYSCALNVNSIYPAERWVELAKNKFGEPVAGLIRPRAPGGGHILILPQLPQLHTVLVEIIEDWCARWSPKYFPDHEGLKWLHDQQYEIPRVTQLENEIGKIQKDAAKATQTLRDRIDEIRKQDADWYTLLNGTGRILVEAVIRSLEICGFKQVKDMDVSEETDPQNLKEDIQVLDRSPALIVDVKGIGGRPSDDDCLQADKHVLMRREEFDGKLKGLSIINHQKNMAPHERDSPVFRTELVGNAEQTGLGLMTAWDLFRIRRNMEFLGWRPEDVMPIFYRKGRINPVPEHYQELGRIVKVWSHSFGIDTVTEVKVGDVIAIEGPVLYEEFTVESLKSHGESLEVAPVGTECGITVSDNHSSFRKGMSVYVLKR